MSWTPEELVFVVDTGDGAWAQILARTVRSFGVYSEIVPWPRLAQTVGEQAPQAVIVAGDPPANERLPTLDVPVWMAPAAEGSEKTPDVGALRSFLFVGCGLEGTWSMAAFARGQVEALRRQIGDRKLVCALSGGVDSAVAATLVHRAVGDQLVCVFVDHGFMRLGEPERVVQVFRDEMGMNVVHVDARERFLSRVAGVTDPEEKRKRIGREFIAVFEEEARRLGAIDYLVQGTLYTDVVESGWGEGKLVKSHHNVGGLPETMNLQLVEPLRQLFKDEVRELGRVLGLSDAIVNRQPFPGPGLALRVIGEVTREKLDMVRQADYIVMDELRKAGLERDVWQSFAVLSDTRTVGVTDGQRTYGYLVAVRAVTSVDGTEARWSRLPWELLDRIAQRIAAEVPGVNRVVYDISSKPPATIEWE